jgi:hypothetical protein
MCAGDDLGTVTRFGTPKMVAGALSVRDWETVNSALFAL